MRNSSFFCGVFCVLLEIKKIKHSFFASTLILNGRKTKNNATNAHATNRIKSNKKENTWINLFSGKKDSRLCETFIVFCSLDLGLSVMLILHLATKLENDNLPACDRIKLYALLPLFPYFVFVFCISNKGGRWFEVVFSSKIKAKDFWIFYKNPTQITIFSLFFYFFIHHSLELDSTEKIHSRQ